MLQLNYTSDSDYVNEIQLTYRHTEYFSQKITSSEDTNNFLMPFYTDKGLDLYESFYLLILNSNNRVVGYRLMAFGSIDCVLVDVRLLFATVLVSGQKSIIVSHNHPSGTLHPSGADKALTKKIKETANLLDIRLLDHLICTREGYYSFADHGLL